MKKTRPPLDLLPGRWYRITPKDPKGGLKLQEWRSQTPLLNFQWKKNWSGTVDTDVLCVISWNAQKRAWLCTSFTFGGVFVWFPQGNVKWCHLKNVTRWVEKSSKNIPDF